MRNILADTKGTRQEIGPVPLISRMTDLWSLPEMEGKGTFFSVTDCTTPLRKECVREKDRVKENTSFKSIIVPTQPCMCGLGHWYPHQSPEMIYRKHTLQLIYLFLPTRFEICRFRKLAGRGDATGLHHTFNSNLTCLHVDRCFRQNFQPDSQISVIVTPCLADIKKKKKRSQR